MATVAVPSRVDRASFTIWSREDIKKVSVKKVTEPKSFEKAGVIHQDGLYSRALGPVKRFELCTTCGQSDIRCQGHYGHIELSVPVYHPMLVQVMFQILNKCCLSCYHFRLNQPSLKLFLAQLDALNCGFDHLIEELEDIASDLIRDDRFDKDAYLPTMLAKKLTKRIEEEKQRMPDFDCTKRPQQRSIVERLSKLFRNFINGQLIKPARLCPHCNEKKTQLFLHQQSVIVMGVNSSKPLTELEDNEDELETLMRGPSVKKSSKKGKKKVAINTNELYVLASDEKKFLTPTGARQALRQMWRNEHTTLGRLFHFLDMEGAIAEEEDVEAVKEASKKEPVDLFFVDTILVPPGKFRPPMSQHGYSFEGPRTAALSTVMKQSVVVQELIGQMASEKDDIFLDKLQVKLQRAWRELQLAVNCLYDNEMDKYGKHKYPGLKQLIDKKEGLFRKNMMGKRVNFAARSVISPDPNILVDQIGVPLVFAKKLSYPEPVTPWNIQQLREAILKGPNEYPGALSIVYDDGVTVSLTKESVRQQTAARLSYNPRRPKSVRDTPVATIVNRHLLTGDVLLFNRQPTLHKPSIMAFRARVLPDEKGFRLHYANCKSFNADFDGDEMNAHLPQSELARSEAYNIASVNHQYLVPKDGSPLGGLIQDHVIAVCILSQRDQFFDIERYNQLVYCALSFLDKPMKPEQPTILRPKRLWTGKQVITTIIKNCIPEGKPAPSLNVKSKIGPKILNIAPEWEKLSDCHVIIRDGELLVGFMDKTNVGATQYGLIHTCYELYGGETSSALMSAFARLATWHLQLYEGFTLGIADILVEDDANADRQASIARSRVVGPDSAKEALGMSGSVSDEKLEDKLREAHTDRNPLPMKKLDAAMKTRTDKFTSEISSRCLPEGLIRRFPNNNLQLMIQTGAKGGTVNALQISCLLGQIELEGRRVPLSMSGRSLPSFKPYDTSPKAGGFVSGRFLTGIQPQEFFFHCMAGREGLIDTAVKTSRSGYLQRCLIKHLEGLSVHYDQTVRDSCGSVIQFLYGEDGLDIVKCQMLKEKAFASLVDNHKIISPTEEELRVLNAAKERYEEEVISRTNEIQQWLSANGEDRKRKIRGSGFLDFLASKLNMAKNNYDPGRPSSVDEEQARESPEVVEVEMAEVAERADQEDQVDRKEMILEERPDSADISSTSRKSDEEQTYSQVRSSKNDEIFADWYALSFKEKKKWNKQWEDCPDPLTAVMNPASHFGVVPELLDEKIEEFVRKNPQLVVDSASLLGATDDFNPESYIACDENPELSKSILQHLDHSSFARAAKPKMTKHEFYNLCYSLYMKMLAQPGEAVGLLAAQSIGEPSTQMTLNTFHFAGRGEMNVTLGIPRLREILMTASAKIGTPSMDLPLLKIMYDEEGEELGEEEVEEQAKKVKLALNAVRLSDVLEYVDITERVVKRKSEEKAAASGRETRARKRSAAKDGDKYGDVASHSVQYDLKFVLLPSKYYKHEYNCRSKTVMKFIEESFVSQLIDSMTKRQRRLQQAAAMFDLSTKRMNKERKVAKNGAGAGGANSIRADDDPEEQELDDYNAKAKSKERAREDESSSEEEEEVDGDNTTERLRNRRNADLDYEEPDEDDLEVGDLEAQAAAAEEDADGDLLADQQAPATTTFASRGVQKVVVTGAEEEAEEEEEEGHTTMDSRLASQRRRAEPSDELDAGDDQDYLGDGDDDGQLARMKEEIAQEEAADGKPLGQTVQIAALEQDLAPKPSNKPMSLLVGGAVKLSQLRASAQADLSEPLRKRKKIDPSGKEVKFDEDTIEQRRRRVKCKLFVLDYEFDTDRERWCKLSLSVPVATSRIDMGALIEAEAKRTYVHRVGNIQRALLVKDVNAKSRGAKSDKMIKTEGVSLLSLVRFNHILDLNAIYSNDIHAIANTYGIEAASQAIRREMANVFAVYGIEVDPRHLSLIADYMTYSGSIRGMNRMSMEASASPFQQMSFESTIRYLKWATILGLYDDIKSPSAALVFGRPTRGGTGLFSLESVQNVRSPADATRRWDSRPAANSRAPPTSGWPTSSGVADSRRVEHRQQQQQQKQQRQQEQPNKPVEQW